VDEVGFWALIDECRNSAGGTGERMAAILKRRLRELDGPTILAFDDHWYKVHRRAYTWPLWDAAVLLLGWVGDDSFGDVRDWLISHGRSTFERVVEDPDSLVDLDRDRDNAFVESYGGLTYRAYLAVTGTEPPRTPPSGQLDPVGTRTNLKDENAVRAAFPRLAARSPARG
jgi:hypothetical protein